MLILSSKKIAIDETKTDIDKKYTEISNTATKLNTEYNNLTSNYYTKEATNSLISSTTKPKYSVVNELPTSDISTDIIYLKSTSTTSTDGIYEMYTYQDSNWVKIGTSNPDLADYYTKELANSTFATKTEINDTNSNVSQLKENINKFSDKILSEEYADLLHEKTPVENWYIDVSNGEGKTLKQFFSYLNIDVSDYIGEKIYPYTSFEKSYNSSRSVVFYDEDGMFISGTGVSSSNPINGIEVPHNSKTVSVCFNYDSEDNQSIKPKVYYLANNKENKNNIKLQKDISVDYSQIKNIEGHIPTKTSDLLNDSGFITFKDVNTNDSIQRIRKPTISFIFDDGLPSTSDLVTLFDSYGWKCGFAILSNANLPNIKDKFLSYQLKGYEILSHSTDGIAMQDGSLTVEDVEAKMKISKETLINNGFNITGWVTPSTWLNNKYFDNLCKYYEYGFGHLDTNQVVNHHTFWGNDIRQLERWSLQSKTLEQTKTEIDATVNECGYLCFYAHAYPSTGNDNFTVENMKAVMDYIKQYVNNGMLQVLIPRDAINDYYATRHSDLLNLYNKN